MKKNGQDARSPNTSVGVGSRPVAVETLATEIALRLRKMGHPDRAQGVQRFFKHEVRALGITTPTLRGFIREYSRRLRGSCDVARAIELCGRLLLEPELEIRGAGILFLGEWAKDLTPALLKQAERWLDQRLDNWALVDGFCGSVLSPLYQRHPETEQTLERWSKASSLWLRRAALVTLVPVARHGERLETAYRLVEEHLNDPEDLMHKAGGWLLREAGKTDMARLRRFLLQHGPSIPRTTLRYAIERFPVGERVKLFRATREHSH